MKEAKQGRTVDDWMNDIWKRKRKSLIGILSRFVYIRERKGRERERKWSEHV